MTTCFSSALAKPSGRAYWPRASLIGTVLSAALPGTPPNPLDTTLTDEERVVTLAQERGSISRQDMIDVLHCDQKAATNLLKRLLRHGTLRRTGEKKGARYAVPGKG